ncbi:MAG: inorganic pyrophosphatase [Patescibacteria group bacterium]|jgi:inorganic pyrophosphatase|nr:inorganic pyrophosphatase [Patescibacteria group bacterium]
MKTSKSLEIAKGYLGKKVQVFFDRPLGAKHPKHGFVYEANYGYLPGIKSSDGEDLDAYYLGVSKPLQEAEGICIAIIHRENDDDKLVVVPKNIKLSDEEILKATAFQEKWFKSIIIRKI